MPTMQQRRNNQSRKTSAGNWTSTTLSMQILLPLLLSIALISAVTAQAEALKIIVQFKYSEWQKDHPQTLNKITLNAYSKIDTVFKKLSLVKLPTSKTINLDVQVGKKFTVALNSYATDDGNQNSGINHPAKVPEKIKVKVP